MRHRKDNNSPRAKAGKGAKSGPRGNDKRKAGKSQAGKSQAGKSQMGGPQMGGPKTSRPRSERATEQARPSNHQPSTRASRYRNKNNSAIYLYGLHAVRAAYENKRRRIVKIMTTPNAWERLAIENHDNLKDQFAFPVEMTEARDLDRLLGKDAIHQGIAAEVLPLPAKQLDQLKDTHLIVVLDEVTDPHNVGAIMRSAVALGAGAIITTSRNSPQESGVLAKSASGALEMIDHIQVKNLGEAIEELHFIGFQTIGLDSEGPAPLEETFQKQQIALVLGAEGKGLRQKTRTIVSDLARLDMPGAIKSLNVSNAATLSLYAAHKFIHA